LKKRYIVLFSILSVLFLAPVTPDFTDEPQRASELFIDDLVTPLSSPVTLWFVSNEMGQALRNAYSLTALRGKYALSVMPVAEEFLPDEFRYRFQSGWNAECRTLYEDGELQRIQWVFMDESSVTRFVSAKSPEGAGFTEIYNEQGLLSEESRFDAPVEEENEEGGLIFKESEPVSITYSYREAFLMEAKSDEWSDVYRYARNNQIRAIERTYAATKTRTRIDLPRTIKDLSFEGALFVSPVSAYSSAFLQDVLLDTGKNTVYTLNEKGRILTETRHGEDGKVSGILTNTWDDDRIISVVWEHQDDNRRVDYIYNGDGELTNEKNYRNETLEREVALNYDGDSDEEIETLYLNGQPVLRAVWQDGRKIKEESLRNSESASRRRAFENRKQ
jgi:antitoxin component YwqK of YwqJK toxin-antitoxin module